MNNKNGQQTSEIDFQHRISINQRRGCVLEFTVRKVRTKIFTGSPNDVEEQVNIFLNTLDQMNFVDIKVTTLDGGIISAVVVYKVVQKLQKDGQNLEKYIKRQKAALFHFYNQNCLVAEGKIKKS